MPAKRPRPKKPTARKGKAPKKGLLPSHDRFVREYLVDLNGQRAAERAGFAPRTARITASKLLTLPNVKVAVEAGKAKRAAKTDITQEKVLGELTILAHSNVDDYAMDESGRLVPAEGRGPEVMRAVSSVKYRTRTVGAGESAQVVREVEFRLWDKPGTLKLEGRHVGLFPNEVKLSAGQETLAEILKMAHELNSAQG